MAFVEDRFSLPFKAASALVPKDVVRLASLGVIRCASTNFEPFGLVEATGATPGLGVAVFEEHTVQKAIAGASLGYGTDVGIATVGIASGAQPDGVATVTQLGPVSAASGSVVHRVGIALEPAAAGEIFSVYLKPRQLSGTP